MRKLYLSFILCMLSVAAWSEDGDIIYSNEDVIYCESKGVILEYRINEYDKTVTVVGAPDIILIENEDDEEEENDEEETGAQIFLTQDIALITSITVPSTVKGYRVKATSTDAFAYNYPSLKTIVFPEGMETLRGNTLANCGALENVTLPSSLTKMNDGCFNGCGSLKELTLPINLNANLSSTFDGLHCRNLKTLNILCRDATWVLECRRQSFVGGESANLQETVEHLRFGKDVERIARYMTTPGALTALRTIKVDADNPLFDSRNDCNAVINTSTNTLIYGCVSTVIPSSVTEIGGGAFAYRSELTKIDIPEGVKTIAAYAFAESGLNEAHLPTSLTKIDCNAFYACRSLEEVTIPDGVTVGPGSAGAVFGFCESLKKVTFGKNCVIGAAFKWCNSLDAVAFGDNWRLYSSDYAFAFSECPKLSSLTLGNTEEIFYSRIWDVGLSSEEVPRTPITIYSYITNPKPMSLVVGAVGSYYDWTYIYPAKLYVPKGTKEKYLQTEDWNKCGEIIEMDAAAVLSPKTAVSSSDTRSYNLGGQRLATGARGISITRMADGSVRKVFSR